MQNSSTDTDERKKVGMLILPDTGNTNFQALKWAVFANAVAYAFPWV